MSLGNSPADIIIVATFCKDLYRKCRDAGGEYDEISREVRALHTVLKHLRYEVEAPESPLNRERARWTRQLTTLINDCDHTLRQLDGLIVKYGRLAGGPAHGSPTSSRGMWDKMRFGSTELDQLGATRVKLISHKSSLTLFLDTIQLHQNETMQATLDNHGGQLDRILDKVDGIAARMGQHNGSIMTNYDDDDKEVWKQFRRELVAEGFSSDVLQQHKDVLRAYIREIDQKGLLEEVAVDPAKPATKVGGVNPERWLESVQSEQGNSNVPSLKGLHITAPADTQKKPGPSILKPPSTLLSPIQEQPRRNSEGTQPRTVPQLTASNDSGVAVDHSDSSSYEDSRRSLIKSSNALVIRTSDLVPAAFHVPSKRLGDATTQVEYGSSPNWRDTISESEPPINERSQSRLAPDQYGNEIPADAKWTKVARRLISPEVLEQDRRRYEARPDFVAILGVLTRSEIEDLAARTAAHRHARHIRHHPPPTLTPQSSDIPPQKPPRPNMIPIPIPVPFPNTRNKREETPSSTDYTESSDSELESTRRHPRYRPQINRHKPSYAGSDAGSIHGYPNPFGQPVAPPSPTISRDGERFDDRDSSYKTVNGSSSAFNGMPRSAPEGDRVRFDAPQFYTHEPRSSHDRNYRHDSERHRDRDNDERRDRERSHRNRDHDRPRDRERDDRRRRERDRGDRDARGPNKEVEQMKKKRWKENLTAAGIGGAAVSLLNVLTEAAEGL